MKIVYITCKDEKEALKMGHILIKEKLAACVNIVPVIKSIYKWKGKVTEDAESIVFVKTTSKKVKKLIFVEPSEHMIKVAKAKFIPEQHKNIEFKQTGFPNCRLEKQNVDIIITINDPFQILLTVEEQISALKDLYESLKPGGLLLIDNKNFFSLIKIYRTPEVTQVKFKNKMYTYVNEHEILPLKEQWIHTYHFFVEDFETGKATKYDSKHILKMVSPTEMRLLFEKTGFQDIEITTHPLADEHEASRMWCFGRKP